MALQRQGYYYVYTCERIYARWHRSAGAPLVAFLLCGTPRAARRCCLGWLRTVAHMPRYAVANTAGIQGRADHTNNYNNVAAQMLSTTLRMDVLRSISWRM